MAGSNGKRAVLNENPAQGRILRVVGLDSVVRRRDIQAAAEHGYRVVAPQTMVCGSDRDVSADNQKVVLAADTVLEARVYGQRSVSVDGQIILAEQGRIGFLLDRISILEICPAVGQAVLCALRQCNDQLVTLGGIYGCACLVCDIHAVQNDMDLIGIGGGNGDLPVGQRAGDHIGSRLRNRDHAAVYRRSGTGDRDRSAVQDDFRVALTPRGVRVAA